MMQCVILAGGLGTRMQNVTKGLPKALLPVRNQPFLHYQLSWLAKQGVTDVLLCIGHGGDQIEQYVRKQPIERLRVECLNEGSPLRGTGGALRLAFDKGYLDERFLVTYGDAFLPIDFSQVWAYFQTRKESALMVVFKNAGRWGKSNAIFENEKVVRYNKRQPTPEMTYMDYGVSALRATLIEKEIPPEQPYDLADLFTRLSERHDLAGLEVKTRFYEIGSPEGLKDFETYLATHAA